MGNLHQVVVHHGGEVIDGQTVRLEDDVVVYCGVVDGDVATDGIYGCGLTLSRRLKADDMNLAGFHLLLRLCRAELAAKAINL